MSPRRHRPRRRPGPPPVSPRARPIPTTSPFSRSTLSGTMARSLTTRAQTSPTTTPRPRTRTTATPARRAGRWARPRLLPGPSTTLTPPRARPGAIPRREPTWHKSCPAPSARTRTRTPLRPTARPASKGASRARRARWRSRPTRRRWATSPCARPTTAAPAGRLSRTPSRARQSRGRRRCTPQGRARQSLSTNPSRSRASASAS